MGEFENLCWLSSFFLRIDQHPQRNWHSNDFCQAQLTQLQLSQHCTPKNLASKLLHTRRELQSPHQHVNMQYSPRHLINHHTFGVQEGICMTCRRYRSKTPPHHQIHCQLDRRQSAHSCILGYLRGGLRHKKKRYGSAMVPSPVQTADAYTPSHTHTHADMRAQTSQVLYSST